MHQAISEFFRLEENGTTFRREVLGGATTFFTMAYIIFVNPTIMAETGMDHGAIFVGTCLAAAMACFFMGLFANWPVALAPGMGLNAYFTYVVVGEMGYSWQTALAAVFIAGILFFAYNVINSLFKGKKAGDDPWDAWTLEWATTSPPPDWNFQPLPTVASARPLWDQKHPEDPDSAYE